MLLIALLILEFLKLPFFIEYESLFASSRFIILGITIPNIIIAFVGGLYGSLFPDVDVGTSKAFAITYMILILLCLYFTYSGYVMGLFVGLILMAFIIGLKHRGVMHKPYTAIILGIVIWIFFESIFIATFFTYGYLIHLVCDIPPKARCKECGRKFNPKSANQKYCNRCR